jgi:trigger factor
MEVTQTQAQGLKREFKVVLPAAEVVQRIDGQLAELKAKAQIRGFRPGKVPISHLKRLYGRSIMADAVQEAVNEANQKIVEENELRLAGSPKIEFQNNDKDLEKMFEAQSDLVFTVALEVLPKIEVPGLDDIEIERSVAEVSSGDVDQVLARLAETNRSYAPKEADAAAEPGDKATVNFTGTIDGELFDGGSGQDVDVVLGSGSFLPGFEAQIAGMKTGERRTIAVTFPSDYSVAKLAGKTAVFDVALNALAAPGQIAIGNELAAGLGFEDLAKLKERVHANIEREYLGASRARWKRDLLDALDKKFLFEVPESMVAQEFEAVWQQVSAERSETGRSYEEDQTTEEKERDDCHKIAERRVRLGLLLAQIGESANIQVTDDEVAQAVAQRVRAFPGDAKVAWDFYRKNPRALAEVRAPLFEEKVVDYIISKVRLTNKMVSKEELLSLNASEDKKTNDGSRLESAKG